MTGLAPRRLMELVGRALTDLTAHHVEADVATWDDGWLATTGIDFYLANWGGVTTGGPDVEARIREIAGRIAGRGVPGLFVFPDPETAALPVCDELGLDEPGQVPSMIAALTTVPPPRPLADDYVIERVRGARAADVIAPVIAEGFGGALDVTRRWLSTRWLNDPEVTAVVAWEGRQVVSGVIASVADGLVSVDVMATASSAQRRGVGRAVLTAALAIHREAGIGHAFLLAASDAVGFYERLGFAVVGEPTRRMVHAG